MVNNTKPHKGLTSFTVLIKNNHRGNNRVAYVRMVSVQVYGHTVVASSQRGIVEVKAHVKFNIRISILTSNTVCAVNTFNIYIHKHFE